ncbi:hypothetical protein BDZ89DRAFT_149462 [Hymenopellis radicata]|nr:hypothetical protein BDZ89DRAFT_149462 [Hymenopellis radicata]
MSLRRTKHTVLQLPVDASSCGVCSQLSRRRPSAQTRLTSHFILTKSIRYRLRPNHRSLSQSPNSARTHIYAYGGTGFSAYRGNLLFTTTMSGAFVFTPTSESLFLPTRHSFPARRTPSPYSAHVPLPPADNSYYEGARVAVSAGATSRKLLPPLSLQHLHPASITSARRRPSTRRPLVRPVHHHIRSRAHPPASVQGVRRVRTVMSP